MPKSILHDVDSGFLEKAQLVKLKLRAMRAGVWFRALPRIDRVLVDLTIKVAGTVRSFTLAKSILSIIRKLDDLLESKLLRAIREIGFPTSRRLSSVAQKWGNVTAKNWSSDGRFARFLAVMALNEPRLFNG